MENVRLEQQAPESYSRHHLPTAPPGKQFSAMLIPFQAPGRPGLKSRLALSCDIECVIVENRGLALGVWS